MKQILVINKVAGAVTDILQRSDPARRVMTIKPVAAVGKRGKRARRAAFYERARICRLMTRIARAGFQKEEPEFQERFRNAVIHGTSHPEWRA